MFRSIVRRAMHEVGAMLPPTLFFLVGFNLLVLTVALLSDGHTVSAVSHAKATVGALLVGKAVLLAEMLPFMQRFAGRPLIHGIAWKVTVYVAAAMAVHLAERLVSAALGPQGLAAGAERDLAGIDWRAFLVVQLWLVLLFVVYTVARETAAALGPERVRELFLGRRQPPRHPAGRIS